jgi:DNA-binding protein H-NS
MEQDPVFKKPVTFNLEELTLEQLQELKKKVETAESTKISQEKATVLSEIKLQVSTYKITAEEIFGKSKVEKGNKDSGSSKKEAVYTYYNAETGTGWVGRGPRPKEFKGLSDSELEKFKLAEPKALSELKSVSV